jgi:hypothetical protein
VLIQHAPVPPGPRRFTIDNARRSLLRAAYYVLVLVTGAWLIPWLVDRGWFPFHLDRDGRDGRDDL